MTRHSVFFAAVFTVLAFAVSVTTLLHAQDPAPMPPMGWNSWDAYGLTIDEADYRANVTVLAGLKEYGWTYAVIDEGWYMENPNGRSLAEKKYLLDGNGILLPVPSRFPSSADGAGFKPLADWVHQQGLKFGIHIVRGIPRDAVKANLPIAGSSFHASDAADLNSPCGWDDGNWGVADNTAGQAYYDSMLKLYAGWGLDFLKVDCISDHPYRPTEIRQIAEAIRKTGRPIVLSLSPGPTQLEHAAEVAEYAQMWRITNDHWDAWTFPRKPGDDEYPFGLRDEFDRLAKWFVYAKPGNWPDADMLPWGWLGPHPGMGEPRQSRLTHDEQQTEFTLWAIARSPLILGANLTKLDEFTRSLISNQSILFMNQNVTYSHPVDLTSLGAGFENARAWRATINAPGARNYAEFLGFFNLDDKPMRLRASWTQLGLDGKKHLAQNVWSEGGFKESKEVTVTLPAHGSTAYEIR
ncbi:MAG: glycoside hydrolase family 27 protein [Terracidiphilus sp.]